ncbi:hypothetical protein CJP72_05280 [Citrobacter sp. NCU1]|uniref:lytic transglycosylase domain-containing protein n=1 Tax=Citrobacter sp. NCU1 TaxID=2026683 RepID=UPI001390BD13|nr:lytic transglycosylase domain-containing protein [Citrobacter sp. NCU1]NDO80209.1 hypothetical protein [Citrobacter sp. NCU1]
MSESQLPVLTLDFSDEKIQKLTEIADKFKNAFAVGPGGFSVPQQPAFKPPVTGGGGKKPDADFTSGIDKFFKGLNKEAEATAKTFGVINKTLATTTSTLKGLFTTTVSWGAKIAAISGGGVFGYGFMAHRATEQYKSAQGLNVTTGEQQAAHNVFGTRFSATSNIMQALATAQQDRTSEESRALMALGLNPADSPGKNLPDFLAAVDRMRKHYGENALPALRAMGVSWIGAGDLNQIAANSSIIPQLRQQYDDQSRHLDSQTSPQVMKGYQDVTANFLNNSSRIGNAFLSSVSRLNGPITQLSDGLTASIERFLNGRNGKALFDSIGNGLQKLGDWLGSDDFQRDMKSFADTVSTIVRALGKAAQWFLGFVEGSGSGSTFASKAGEASKTSYFSKEHPATSTTPAVPALSPGEEKDSSFWGLLKATGKTLGGIGGVIGGNMFPDMAKRWSAGGWANYGDNKLPRGLRNNNPGNLNFVGQYGAKLEDGPDARFAQFPSMLDGIAALDKQVGLYLKRGTNTIDKIIDIYAPKSDKNDTNAYKKYLTTFTGLSANDKIDGSNTEQIKRLIVGIINHENGPAASTISNDDVLRAMAMNRGGQVSGGPTQSQSMKVEIVQKPGSDIQAQVKGITLAVR